MRRVLIESWPLFAGLAMLMVANGLLATLLSVRAAALGFPPATIGLMQAAYPLGALVGATWAPRLIAKVGHVRTFGALASLSSVAAVVHLVTADAASWSAMRLLAGLCFPGLYVVAESWLNARAAPGTRARTLGVYFVVQTLGAAVGQALAGTGAEDMAGATALFALTSILISLSLVPLLLISRTPVPTYEEPERLSLSALWRISPTGLVGAVLNGAAQAMLYIALPLYGLARGLSAAEATGVLVLATIVGGIAQFPAGWLSDRLDRRVVIAGLSAVGAGAYAGLAMGLPTAWTTGLAAIGAAATMPIYAVCVAQTADRLRPSQIVPASGALVLALNAGLLAGSFAGPLAVGTAPAAYALLLAGLCAATAAVALIRRGQAPAPDPARPARPIAVQGAQSEGPARPPVTADDRTSHS